MSAGGSTLPATRLRSAASSCEVGPIPVSRAHRVGRQFHRMVSVKAGPRTVMCLGALAADAVMMAEGDLDVVGLCDRPLRLHGPIGVRSHITLDLSVTYRSGRRVHYAVHREGGLLPGADGRQLPRDWIAIERLASDHGHEISVLTDVEIERHRQRISNWRRLLPFVLMAHQQPNPGVMDEIQEILKERVDVTLEELPHLIAPVGEPYVLPAIARLLHEGACDANLDKHKFTNARPISSRGEKHA